MSAPRKDPGRGTWYFVLDAPSPDGRRRQVRRRGFKTKRAAIEAQRRLLGDIAGGVHADPAQLTVGEYLSLRWLPTLAGRMRPTTEDSYRRICAVHLIPRLGTIRLQRLDAGAVEAALAGMAGAGMAPKTARNVHGVLSKALADALRWRLVGVNVASGVELPRVPPAAPRAWDADQLRRFLDATGGDRLGPLWRFFAITGCRRGEALGLRWRYVDLDAGTATIVGQRVIAGGTVIDGPPKTRAGARTVALDGETVRVLRAWHRIQLEEYVRLAVRPDHDLVFTGEDGRALWPQRITATFKRTVVGLGLPAIGVHGLRHSAATWLIGAGVSPKTVSQRLGHSTPAITLSIYSHVLPGHDQAAVDALAAALAPSEKHSVTNM
jgi:integrase